ncbi:hypothetical protein BD289DRAFT_458553 [Coniella lustricola]|uniref:Methyltransferase type 11 domain-containing protein n=1 Tax=Coniella lustricola TaxID=2025994 RepID=A0A2T3AIX9_9PEZI|nr:hypothetical protein BD289DRAFT_458553 [Coniella lustricola]
MTAPTLPSSPSSASFSGEEVSSQGSSYKADSWQRSSVMTDVTEFDDLYGVSDEDSEPEVNKRRSSRKSRHSSTHFEQARKSLPQLHIPNESHLGSVMWSAERPSLSKKNVASPVPPTPPSAVAMSPAMLSFMKAQHAHIIPTISAPPSLDGSLDGSLTSEQLAALTAPTTPVMAGDNPEDSGDWAGVQLQPGAMETLQALSGAESGSEEEMHQRHQHHDQVFQVSAPPMTETCPGRPRLLTSNISRSSFVLSPAQQRVSQDLTKLEIPSPGGFFSGLSPRSRSTWHYGTSSTEDIIPPTSTTAEQFYRVPWSIEDAPPLPSPSQGRRPSIITSGDYSDEPVEQVIEMLDAIKEEDVLTAMRIKSPVTAIRFPQAPTTMAEIVEEIMSPLSPRDDVAVTEIVVDYDPEYARKQQEISGSHIDRTEGWLRAQFAYLRGVGFEPSEAEADIDPEKAKVVTAEEMAANGEGAERAPTPPPKDGGQAKPASGLARKKTVRFTTQVTAESPVEPMMPCDLPSKLLKQESTYYRAFQSMTVKTTQSDAFVSRSPRFEALQAQRISLREQHRAQLLGKYQLSVVPQSAKKRMSANVARGDDIVFEDPEKMRADKEAEALKQMATANWHVAATKMLNSGRLVCAPVHKRLGRLSLAPGAAAGPKRLRILDLGGQSTCDWAWHAAHQYPNSKVYTVTTKAIRQLSNANVRGPPNHRQVAVTSLAKLPFADDQFDLVSARELHSILKNSDVLGDPEDEWDACLQEIMRVLKPGGYVDFSIMDSDLVNAGPLGLAKSVEFGFTLKTLGYDPSPTKSFISRLSHAGFEGIRRGWVMLPLGPKPVEKPSPVRYSPINSAQVSASESSSQQEQEQFGSTNNAAAVAGVAGTWSWERWILRCEMEKAAGELHSGFKLADTVSTDGGVMKEAGKSIDGVAAVISEGRACGAGLRLLKGYARKPEQKRCSQELDELMGTIDMMLDF